AVLARMPVNIYHKDLTGRYIFIHEGNGTDSSVLSDSFLGKTDFDLVPVELAQKYDRDDQYVLSTEQVLELTETYLRSDGNTGYLYITKSPLYDAGGKLIGTQGIFRDITQQHQGERDLLKQHAHYEYITRMHCDVDYRDDVMGGLDEYMPLFLLRLAHWTGQPDPQSLSRQGWHAYIHPDDLDLIAERYLLLTQNRSVLTCFRLRLGTGGWLHLRDTARRRRKAGGGYCIVGGLQNQDNEDLAILK
ncbi:MAG: PAS domain-containing protein, partial [Sphingobacteriia bacterium]